MGKRKKRPNPAFKLQNDPVFIESVKDVVVAQGLLELVKRLGLRDDILKAMTREKEDSDDSSAKDA